VDKAEELREKWGTATGQLWQCGEHRVICGDCADKAVEERVTSGEKAHATIYDPPWDADPQPSAFGDVIAFSDGGRIADVICRWGAPTWVFVWDCVTSWYTPHRPLKRMKLAAWYGDIERYNFDGAHYGLAGEAKTVSNTRGTYKYVPDPRGKHLSDLFQSALTREHAEGASHAKPVDWVRLLIGCCTEGLVYDPFLGSGTTMIACEQLGRKCRGIEISPAYVAVILQRYLDATGKEPAKLA
jgi:hypothetical protein